MLLDAWGGWILATAVEAGVVGMAALAVDAGLRGTHRTPPASWTAALLFLVLLRFLVPPLAALPVPLPVAAVSGVQGTTGLDLLTAILAMAQVVGLLVGMAVLARSAVVLRRTLARSRAVHDGYLRDTLEDLATDLGVRPPRLVITDGGAPAAAGIHRPAILLPEPLLDLDRADLRRVLAHELAHVARRDPLTAAIRTLAVALWWAHPVAWALALRHRAAAEDACDDVVLAMGSRPADYCDTLLACAAATPSPSGPFRGPGPATALGGHPLERRFRRIFRAGAARQGGGTSPGRALAAILAVAALSVPVRFLPVRTDTAAAPDDIVIRHVITDVRRVERVLR